MILSVTDNLVKGAAGQAVQNMNLMFGLPETLAIDQAPLLPYDSILLDVHGECTIVPYKTLNISAFDWKITCTYGFQPSTAQNYRYLQLLLCGTTASNEHDQMVMIKSLKRKFGISAPEWRYVLRFPAMFAGW